jgi:hypothetical protein
MTFLLSAVILFLMAIAWLADRPSLCPKCGMPMSEYDAKRDACVNPYCAGRESINPRIHKEDR